MGTANSLLRNPSHNRTVWIGAAVLAMVVAATGIFLIQRKHGRAAEVTFAPFDNAYSTKTDFAEVEHRYPLSPKALMTLTPANIRNYNQEQVDQIYARLTAGPIPNGSYDGDLFFPKGISGKQRLQEIAGGLKGRLAGLELEKMTILGRMLWKGKVFYRDQRVLRNRIDHLNLLEEFFPDPQHKEALRQLSANGKTDHLYFPAKLYCGQSLMDSRRESVIIDYAFTDDIEGYRQVPDMLAGREGLVVRDEIRMVRPGFYLGRAYAANSFLLNFTLFNDGIARAGSEQFQKTGRVSEDCWVGTQRQQRAAL
jgi:hypothetical protein